MCVCDVSGIDDLLAQHIAHLFIRDPISLFGEKLKQDIETETDHFEVSQHDCVLQRDCLVIAGLFIYYGTFPTSSYYIMSVHATG